MEIEKIKLKVIVGHRIALAELVVIDFGDCIQLDLLCSNTVLTAKKELPFDTLQQLRLELEKMNIKIVCEGARVDVYPSGMQLQTFMAYETKMNEPATKEVYIFGDTGQIEKLVSVNDQEAYHRKWLESVKPQGL